MIGRRVFVAAGVAVVATAPVAAQSGALVGVLSPVNAAQAAGNIEALRRGLREAGLVDGIDFRLEPRFAGGVSERLPVLAAELVALRPRVIVTGSTGATLALGRATKDIPIVFGTMGADPVALGLAASLARPGGNVTGFTNGTDHELIGKRLGLLREAVPAIMRVAALANPSDPSDADLIVRFPDAARAAGLTAELVTARETSEIASAVVAAAAKADALYVSNSPLWNFSRGEIVALVARLRRPAVYAFHQFAAEGGLMAYGVSVPDVYRAAAGYVARILRGESPAMLPVQEPTVYRLAVNLGAARAIGITLPHTLLAVADEVIE